MLRSSVVLTAVLAAALGASAQAQVTSGTISPTAFGAKSWREPVQNVAALPAAGNVLGDVRLVREPAGAVYWWSGSAWVELTAGGAGAGGGGPFAGAETSGGPATLALALASNPENCAAGSLPRGVDASGVAEACGVIVLGTDTSGPYAASASPAGPASTALALAADGSDCSAGNYPLGVDAAGNVQTCTAIPAGVTDHGVLTGLGDDDHPQYALLAGRSGQTLNGGTASGASLHLSGSAHATKGPVVADSRLQVPIGSAAAPGIELGSNGTGFYRIGNGQIGATFETTGSWWWAYNGMSCSRDNCYWMINDDAVVQRTAAAEIAIKAANFTTFGTIKVEQVKLVARASAPTCAAPGLYVDSDSSNTLCYCDGSTWVALYGTGPCS